MDDMDTTIKDNIPLPKPVFSEIFDKEQIQRQIRQVLERHANVVHKMLSSEKKARHDMREQLNKSFADLRTDFDGFEDAINTKVGDLNMKLGTIRIIVSPKIHLYSNESTHLSKTIFGFNWFKFLVQTAQKFEWLQFK
jgi:seryl-tRNA synthetase